MATALAIGTRYECPPGEQPSWFHEVLAEVRGDRDGDIPIRLEATTGHRVDGFLCELDQAISPGPHGKLSIDSHGEDLVIAAEMVQAFTLLPGKTAGRKEEQEG